MQATIKIFRGILNSKNSKTGGVVQTYSARSTCSEDCPFRGENGCYAESFHCRRVWDSCEGEKGLTLSEFRDFIQANTAPNQVIRHNVAGDICKGKDIDLGLLFELIFKVFVNRRAYTYTHCDKNNVQNLDAVKFATAHGFMINVSCETPEQADRVIRAGCHAVMTVEKHFPEGTRSPEGNIYVPCPAQTSGKTCSDCLICQERKNKFIPTFEAHGFRSRRVIAILRQINGGTE